MALAFSGSGTPLSAQGFSEARGAMGGVPQEALWAVLAVETSGCGFLPDRRPKILFERHKFAHHTNHQYDASHPDISGPWDPAAYGAMGAHQYERLAVAIGLDRAAALKSASWGLGQIMGENFQAAGYPDIEAMVADFVIGEDRQLMGMARFISAGGLGAALVACDWADFASHYNGPNYAVNHYDQHLQTYNALYTAHGCPDIDVRAAQALASYLGYPVRGIDGLMGPKTAQALSQAQQDLGVSPVSGQADAATLAALTAAVAALP